MLSEGSTIAVSFLSYKLDPRTESLINHTSITYRPLWANLLCKMHYYHLRGAVWLQWVNEGLLGLPGNR